MLIPVPVEAGTVIAKGTQDFKPRRKRRMQISTFHTRDRHVFQSINIREVDQLDRWCRVFGVTRSQLTSAVSTVGANPDLVRRYLRFQDPVAA